MTWPGGKGVLAGVQSNDQLVNGITTMEAG